VQRYEFSIGIPIVPLEISNDLRIPVGNYIFFMLEVVKKRQISPFATFHSNIFQFVIEIPMEANYGYTIRIINKQKRCITC
jgi:hypothetical protein